MTPFDNKKCLHKHSNYQFILFSLFLHFLVFTAVSSTETEDEKANAKPKVAIIGGGIGGTFATKYLTDYDVNCSLHSITLFDPFFQPVATTDDVDTKENKEDSVKIQKSRVHSVTLSDQTVVEAGASILYKGNQLVVDMIDNDDALQMVEPFHPSRPYHDTMESEFNTGFGVYDSTNGWVVNTSNITKDESTAQLLQRYNLELYRVNKITDETLEKFEEIYDLLTNRDFQSPDDVWKAVGLHLLTTTSFNDYLTNTLKIDEHTLSWWRHILNYFGYPQGFFRNEMLEAINLCNNNQNNFQMTALAGLVNFVASKGDLFAIKGGNDLILRSAFSQAQQQQKSQCDSTDSKIKVQKQRVVTIVSNSEKNLMEFFDVNGKFMGSYNVVILAAPLQFCQINFMVQGSFFDSNVLHPMALNGLIAGDDEQEQLHQIGQGLLPDSAIRTYTQVYTTIITNGKLNSTYFNVPTDKSLPRSIVCTESGREQLGLTSVSQITVDTGVHKVFTSTDLDDAIMKLAFGKQAIKEHVEIWGGTHGGATPNFNGGIGTSSTQFLLYDGSINSDDGPALYYINAMEAAVSTMEISAIGAKAVSKLVARRLKLLPPLSTDNLEEKDEL